jgi:hypothetical protein
MMRKLRLSCERATLLDPIEKRKSGLFVAPTTPGKKSYWYLSVQEALAREKKNHADAKEAFKLLEDANRHLKLDLEQANIKNRGQDQEIMRIQKIAGDHSSDAAKYKVRLCISETSQRIMCSPCFVPKNQGRMCQQFGGLLAGSAK